MLRVLCIVLCLGSASHAQTYDEDDLLQTRERIAEGLRLTISDMLAVLTPAERAQIGQVVLDLPLHSPVQAGPRNVLGFFTDLSGRRVIVPIENWTFLSDYLILQAWFESNACRPEQLLSYFLQASGGTLDVTPFEAFDLSKSTVLRDSYTNEASLHSLASAGEFILAHELGHLFYDHRPLGPGEDSVMQEQQADAFAMTVLSRKGRTTAGIAFYFTIASFVDMADSTDARTHPVTSARLDAVADRIRADPASFLADQADPVIEVPMQLSIANDIAALADVLTDQQFRRSMGQRLPAMFPAVGFPTACSLP